MALVWGGQVQLSFCPCLAGGDKASASFLPLQEVTSREDSLVCWAPLLGPLLLETPLLC